MGAANLISLIVTTILFVIWAVLMFATLHRLSRRAGDRHARTGGGYFRWAGHSLASFGAFATAAEDGPARRRLVWLTLLLVAAIAARALLISNLSA